MSRTEEGLRDTQIKSLWEQQEDVTDVCISHLQDLHFSVDMEGAMYAHHELQCAINVLLKLVLKEAQLRDDDETDTLIHCKDCKYFVNGSCRADEDSYWEWNDNCYCSRAERKEE